MPKYLVPCADGTDRHCHEYIDQTIDIPDLSGEQLADLAKTGQTTISRDQLKDSAPHIREQIEPGDVCEDNDVSVDVQSICSACGSDQSRSDEGGNITAA